MWGASSWICGPANFLIEPVVSFYNKFNAGDIAGAKQEMTRMFPVMACLEAGKFVQKVKYGCELLASRWAIPASPLPLTDAEKQELKTAMAALEQ
jgi:4-hydroxy-tetrahydrodipicolinate synthase